MLSSKSTEIFNAMKHMTTSELIHRIEFENRILSYKLDTGIGNPTKDYLLVISSAFDELATRMPYCSKDTQQRFSRAAQEYTRLNTLYLFSKE